MKPFVLLAACVALLLTGCASADAGDDGRMPVTAAFYPLQFAAERVGGEHVRVTSLTKPGVEPHDLELTPRAVGQLAHAKAVVYLAGFQPAVDQAVRTQAKDAAVDVTPAARLEGKDPHFWLDPTRLADVATALGDDFARRDPANAADYRANAAALVADLEGLDAEFRAGLAQCRTRELVTGHAAFGYLAERYDLHQEGVAGVSPDIEPDAATLRDLSAHVRDAGVTTVYSESLVSPALAETVAREAGVRVAVLDPLEGITDASRGHDYLEVMRANLATLRAGQECS
ncbi:MAG TPA: metal ABC transporter substrate-binding protein [Ornithinibacter sp.]|nr:metal ABC transporter substrate-binding protein [Ornithinibacter sp.]